MRNVNIIRFMHVHIWVEYILMKPGNLWQEKCVYTNTKWKSEDIKEIFPSLNHTLQDSLSV